MACISMNNVVKNFILIRKYCTALPIKSRKKKSLDAYAGKFVDWKRLNCKGGNGGSGMICFTRIFANPLAGPGGGDGGHGSHVIFRASKNIKSLELIPPIIKGENGEAGHSKNCHGANGKHVYIDVPVGSTFRLIDDTEEFSLDKEGEIFVGAHGGAGGHGNSFFLSNENRHPRIAEIGAEGENNIYVVELKVMADAGMIGFPNAGKSTLLQAISRARPKVAAYPFTTLNPHVGVIHYDDYEQISVADLPGLVDGSHNDKGLGISFLKHVERCKCLLFVLDLSEENPWDQLEKLKHELEMFTPGLSNRPHAIIGNKIDVPCSIKNLELLKQKIEMPVYPISAKFGKNIVPFLMKLRKIYDENL